MVAFIMTRLYSVCIVVLRMPALSMGDTAPAEHPLGGRLSAG